MAEFDTDPSVDPLLEESRLRLVNRPSAAFTSLHPAPELSFELFPPSSPAQEQAFTACVDALVPLRPRFFSVTYGAGGSTQSRTLRALECVRERSPVPVAGHLTCVAASREDVDAVIERYHALGIRHIVALRGDAPTGDRPAGRAYPDAAALTSAIAARGGFDISVGAYPEVHPLASSAQADLDNLKRKVDAGANRAITQFFFDPEIYLRFLDRVRAAGITIPIVPGILPVQGLAALQRFAARCGATVPHWLVELFEPLAALPEVRPMVAATVAAELCLRLADRGVHQFHFYTLNKAPLTQAVCHLLGRAPEPVRRSAQRTVA
jgi:methylenetetrahydrofolate reductase (NADPH)